MVIDLDQGGRIPQSVKTFLGPSVGWKYTDAPTNIEYVIGGSGEAIPGGYKGGLLVPDWLVINNWFLASPVVVPSIVIDIYLLSQEEYLAGNVPNAADSICPTNKPKLLNQAAASGLPTDWNTNNGPSVPPTLINQNDFIGFNVDSVVDASLITIVLQCVRIIGPS